MLEDCQDRVIMRSKLKALIAKWERYASNIESQESMTSGAEYAGLIRTRVAYQVCADDLRVALGRPKVHDIERDDD